MEMTNCDDCSVNITGKIDVALELTKIYFKLHEVPAYVSEETIYYVYKRMRELLK